MIHLPLLRNGLLDGASVAAIGGMAAGASEVATASFDTDNWLQLISIIVAAILAFFRGREHPKKGK